MTRRGTLRQRLRSQAGQSTAEFAIIFPFLLIVFLLLAQTVMVLRAQIIVTGAAREAARKGVETASGAMITGAAYSASEGLDHQRMQVDIDCPARKRGEPITVRVQYRVPIYLPFVDRLFPSDIAVSGASTMRIENDREK
jgi:hypothetical protein